MADLDKVRKPVAAELALFEEKFRDAMRSPVPLLNAVTRYIVKSKGKQMRPLFVFLSAKMAGTISDSTYRAAALIELLHTATLVHDDVVDNAYERRGFFSINALWKNKIAVLVGDYLLSKGLLLSLGNSDFRILEIVSDAVRNMSEGELLQIEKSRKLNLSEEIYLEIIRQKTASLISSACAAGASSSGASDEKVIEMKKFGELAGLAFQIKDDLLDFSEDTGKTKGIDLKEKKLTLPVIYILRNSSPAERRSLMAAIRNGSNNHKDLVKVMNLVKTSGGLQYAEKKMDDYKNQALAVLNGFPSGEARSALEDLLTFTIERKK